MIGGGLYWSLHRAQGSSSRVVFFSVKHGDSGASIANRLQRLGLIDNALLFRLDARLRGLGSQLKVGDYRIRPNMSIDQMVGALSVYHDVEFPITIPEGLRLEQIASILQSKGIDSGSFLREANHPDPAYLKASILSDKPAAGSLQGYLFPNTYEVPKNFTGKQFARDMVQLLDREFTPAMRKAVKEQGRTVFQVLILASIVEREARVPSERPLIAGVYMNRLRQHIPLDADPTVQYAAAGPGKWWPQLQDLAVNVDPASPYNTYTHNGLPPGPIANPGLPSIRAAIHPRATKYLYFLAIPHGHGRHVFARTLAGQTANQQKYYGTP